MRSAFPTLSLSAIASQARPAVVGVAALVFCGFAQAQPQGAFRLKSGAICLGWRPHLADGVPGLGGGRCDRAATFKGRGDTRASTVPGFGGGPVPPEAVTSLQGWTPLLIRTTGGRTVLVSPPDWPGLGTANAEGAESCVTLHRQQGDADRGPLTADILPCQAAADQGYRGVRTPDGLRFVSLQRLEAGDVCLTAPATPRGPALFTRCGTDPAQIFTPIPVQAQRRSP